MGTFFGRFDQKRKTFETKPHLTCHGEFIDMISEINTLLGTKIKGLGCRVEVGGIIFIFNSSKSQKIMVFFSDLYNNKSFWCCFLGRWNN